MFIPFILTCSFFENSWIDMDVQWRRSQCGEWGKRILDSGIKGQREEARMRPHGPVAAATPQRSDRGRGFHSTEKPA